VTLGRRYPFALVALNLCASPAYLSPPKTLVDIFAARARGVILVRDFLDDVHGLDNLVRVASEMLLACALIIEREVGPDEARDALKTAGKMLAR
jgi:hypothetical protein